jgi:phage protein U
MPQASFGTFLFGKVHGHWQAFHSTRRSEEGRWNDHDVHLSKPKSEYHGPGLIQIDMEMVLLTSWSGDIRPIVSQLHAYQRNGLAAPLLLGGKPAGPRMSMFILRKFDEKYDRWLKDGVPIRAETKMSFVEYMPLLAGVYV